jgi:hypothetical protein
VTAALSDVATIAPWTFMVGVVVGFVMGARYRIDKRD